MDSRFKLQGLIDRFGFPGLGNDNVFWSEAFWGYSIRKSSNPYGPKEKKPRVVWGRSYTIEEFKSWIKELRWKILGK